MKLRLAFIFALVCASTAQAILWIAPSRFSAPSGATYLINQNFETPTTGYDNGETWTETGGPNPVYTPAIVGSQSLRIYSASSSAVFAESPTFSAQSDVWYRCRFRINALNNFNGDAQFSVRGGVNTLAGLYVQTDGTVKFKVNGADSAASATTLSTGTNYYVWIHYVASNTCTLYVSSSSTRPSSDGSGNVVRTGTAGAVNADKVLCYNGFYQGDFIFDEILVSTSSL